MEGSISVQRHLDGLDREWVANTFAGLTLDEKIGQVLHPILINDWGLFEGDPSSIMKKYQLGGSFQAKKSMVVLREFVESCQEGMNVPIVISGDYECRVSIDEGTNFGSAMNLAAIEDLDEAVEATRCLAATVARQGYAVGTRWTFAPVADINFNSINPITNVRSFGDDPERVSVLVSAFVESVQENGMAATLKHFPGDGMDDRDQHVCTTVNTMEYEEWKSTYGRTFQAGVDAGALSIMMGHIALKGVSSVNKWGDYLPGTLDPAMHKYLREELNFDGLIISDAIKMGGCFPHGTSESDIVVKNLAAGSDMVLFVREFDNIITGIKEALDGGVLSMQRLNDAVLHVLQFKAHLGLHKQPVLADEMTAATIMYDKSYDDIGRRIADSSISCFRNRKPEYQIDEGETVLIVMLPVDKPNKNALKLAHQESEKTFGIWQDAFLQYGVNCMLATDVDSYMRQKDNCQSCIYVFPVMPQAGRGSIKLTYSALQIIEQTRDKAPEKKLFVSTGNPYILDELSYLPNFYCLFGSTPNLINSFVKKMMNNEVFSSFSPVRLKFINE